MTSLVSCDKGPVCLVQADDKSALRETTHRLQADSGQQFPGMALQGLCELVKFFNREVHFATFNSAHVTSVNIGQKRQFLLRYAQRLTALAYQRAHSLAQVLHGFHHVKTKTMRICGLISHGL